MLIGLQYQRAVAVMLVVYFHLVLQIEGLSGGRSMFVLAGSCGVDIFFVLSGFVIWTSTLPRDHSPWAFYRRRIARLAPLYWGATTTAAAASLIVPQFSASMQFDPMHYLASLLFVPWPNPSFPPGSDNYLTPLVIPGWSLNYEIFFYLLFGLALPLRPAMRGLWLVSSFLALIIAGWLVTAPPHALAFYASGYLMDFLLGIGIAAYAPRMSAPKPWVAAALLVVATILLLRLEVATLGHANVPVLGLVAAVIVYATIALERRGAMPTIGLLDLLGAASYSIYLTHIFVLAALRVAWKALSMPMTGMGQVMFMVVGLTASATVGTLVHLLYEKPANRLGRRLLRA